jgi:hypothetical protein
MIDFGVWQGGHNPVVHLHHRRQTGDRRKLTLYAAAPAIKSINSEKLSAT